MPEDHPTVDGEKKAFSKGHVFSSFQGRLVGLLLLILVPILVSQAYFSYERYQFRKGIEREANLELARATAKAFDTFVQDVLHQELTISLAFTSSQTLPDNEKSKVLFDNQAGNPAIWHFFWTNPAGIVTAATGSQFIGMDLSDREFYQKIVAGKEWVVSDLLLSKTTRQPSFTISRGMRNERGELLGMIVAGILPAQLDRVLAVKRIGDAGVSLLDSKGMHVYRCPAVQYTWEQRNWLKFYPMIEDALKGKEVVTKVTSARTGINRMAAFVPVPSIGWVASCSRAEKEVVVPIITAILQETGLILLVGFVSLLIAVALSRTISSSVITLRDYALSLGQGEAQNPLNIPSPAEIKDLAEAFNKMAGEIRFREKALRESERREQERAAELAIVLDAAPIPIFIAHDPECLHISGNSAADKLLQNPRGAESSLGAPVGVRPQHFKAVKDGRELRIDELPAQRAASGIPVRDFEFDLVFEDGTTYNLLSYGIPLLDNEGRPRGAVSALVDITERKRAEEALRQSEEQLKALNIELERKVEQRTLELQETHSQYLHAEKLSAIGKLSASIAHEFNSPLQSVMTVLKGLKTTTAHAEVDKKLLELAIGECERMKNLIRSLQDFNRPSSDRKVLMDVHQSLESILLLIKNDLSRKKITIILDFAERLPQIMAVKDQIKQVFLNLLSNAADACQEHGRVITIRTWQVKGRVAVAIHDNGIGIEPDKIDQIFQPFYSTKPEVKGTGLGLSICHGIIQNHQGEIRVVSQPGEGSTFTLLLPVGGGDP